MSDPVASPTKYFAIPLSHAGRCFCFAVDYNDFRLETQSASTSWTSWTQWCRFNHQTSLKAIWKNAFRDTSVTSCFQAGVECVKVCLGLGASQLCNRRARAEPKKTVRSLGFPWTLSVFASAHNRVVLVGAIQIFCDVHSNICKH